MKYTALAFLCLAFLNFYFMTECPCCKTLDVKTYILPLKNNQELCVRVCRSCGVMFIPQIEGTMISLEHHLDKFLTTGYELRVRRKALKMTLSEVYHKVGIVPSRLSNIETGQVKQATTEELEKLNDFYNQCVRNA